MSGGTFDYKQFHLNDIASDIEMELSLKKEEHSGIIAFEMYDIMVSLRKLSNRIHDLDYYLAGDYGEDTYIEKLGERK